MKWNSEQIKAINTVDTNIIVSASAGAGKTTVLVARLIKRIINDQIPINQVLAMTFTEAAASEMKKRLLIELTKQVNDDSLSSEIRAYAKLQLSLAENAYISTIHSFCLNIIKANYAAIGLNPNSINNIASDADKQMILNQAFNNVLNDYLNHRPDDILQVMEDFKCKNANLDNLLKVIDELFLAANNNLDALAWLLKKRQEITTIDDFNQLYALRGTSLDKYVNHQIIGYIDTALLELDNILIGGVNEKYQDNINNCRDFLLTAKENINNNAVFINSMLACANIKHAYRKPSPSRYKECIKAIMALIYDEEKEIINYNASIQSIQIMLDITIEVYQRFQAIKAEKQLLDFNDLEHFAYQILAKDDGLIGQKYQALFKEVMVDEFQDTNNIQFEIINLVSNGKNLFCVGDVKQSIYRFRGAKPQIMQQLLEDNNFMQIYLANNYRSKKTIVDFNNMLFDNLMNTKYSTMGYKEKDNQIADLPSQLENNDDVYIHLINDKEVKGDDEIRANQIKANYIADHILKNMQSTQYTKFSDYCVLVSAHADKYPLKLAFDKLNIPYFIDDKRGFINSSAVSIILSYLRYLTNPFDKISMCAVLACPMYNVDYDAIYTYLHDEIVSDEINQFIDDVKKLKTIHNLSDIFNYLYCINDFYECAIDIQDRTNLDLLFQHSYQKSFTISSFLSYIDLIIDDNKDSAIPIRDDDNVVKVMTIHQSKGLQFNVVYIFSKGAKSAPRKLPIYIDENNISMKNEVLRRDNIDFKVNVDNIINRINIIEDAAYGQEEKLRLLYVALTRAKDRMHIVDTSKPSYEFYGDMGPSDVETIRSDIDFYRRLYTPAILYALYGKSKLFNIVDVIESWDSQAFDTTVNSVKSIEHYTHDLQVINKVKPSLHNIDLKLNLQNLDFAKIGTQVHETIENLGNVYPFTADVFNQYTQDLSKSDQNNIKALFDDNFTKTLLTKESYFEYPFTIMSHDEYVNGIIDFITIDEHITIVDFKTDRNVDEAQLIERYSSQLKTYQLSMMQIFNNKLVNIYIYSLFLQKYIPIN